MFHAFEGFRKIIFTQFLRLMTKESDFFYVSNRMVQCDTFLYKCAELIKSGLRLLTGFESRASSFCLFFSFLSQQSFLYLVHQYKFL